MTQTKTKKALLMSVLSMVLCVAMLVGMTFAWFTDTASTSVNKIQAGKLDVELLMRDAENVYQNIGDSNKFIFGPGSIAQNNNQETLWEPGKTQVAYLAVRNAGNLALKYNIVLNIEDKGLADALQYVIVPQGKLIGKDQAFAGKVAAWSEIKGGAEQLKAGTVIAAEKGCLDEIAHDSANVNETEYFALVLHMDENAGNEYQGKAVNIDLKVIATQVAAEFDSNGNDYDKDAVFPAKVVTASTLAEFTQAIKTANTGDTIKLMADIDSARALSISKELTIDLNGKNLTGTAYNTIKLTAGADLTIEDSSIENSGKIVNTYVGRANPTTIDLNGANTSFTLLSGTVEANAKDYLYSIAIGNSGKKACTVNIAGGTVTVPDGHLKSRAISASNGMKLNISGGEIKGGLYGIDLYAGSVTTITGGKVFANAFDGRTDEYGKQYAIHAKGEATLTIGSLDAATMPEVKGIKFESSGVNTELPTINLVKGNITNPIYSLETKYNYELFKLGIVAGAPVTFTDNTAHFFLPDGLKMVQDGSSWKVTAK